MINIDDIRDFDGVMKKRISRFKESLRDRLAPHHLTLAEARVHKVLILVPGAPA